MINIAPAEMAGIHGVVRFIIDQQGVANEEEPQRNECPADDEKHISTLFIHLLLQKLGNLGIFYTKQRPEPGDSFYKIFVGQQTAGKSKYVDQNKM